MAAKWRVAILGLGHWYSAYNLARALPEYPKAELVAVAWHNRTQLDEFANTFHIEAYEDYESVLQRKDVDIVLIASPVAEIPELTIRAAQSGKHILLGKPMAMTVEQADRMVEAVESAKVLCMPFQSHRRLIAKDWKARIAQGEIGEIILLHQTCRWSIAEDWFHSGQPGWFVDPKQVPGGAFIDEGIYWIDFFRWMTGSEIVRVEAKTANLVHKDIEVEDWGMATFTFANGVIATLEGAWTINSPQKTKPSPKNNAVLRTEIIGTQGEMIHTWFREPGFAVLAAGAKDWVYERQSQEILAPAVPQPLGHVIDCLENGTQTVADIREARNSFVVAMAAYESARTGKPIDLSWA